MAKNKLEGIEQYLVCIYDVMKAQATYVLVPSNTAMARMFSLLDTSLWVIMTVAPIANVKDYDEFIKSLIYKKKPEDLNYGGIK